MSDEEPPFPSVLDPGPRLDLLDRLRAYADEYAELARHSARGLDLHLTDMNALIDVLWFERQGDPLSPARLAERVGLTSGATNALINRLEKAGYVARSREHSDRRQVTLRATALARRRASAINRRPSQLLEDAFDRLDPQAIESMAATVEILTSTLAQINQELAEQPPAAAEPGPKWRNRSRSARKVLADLRQQPAIPTEGHA